MNPLTQRPQLNPAVAQNLKNVMQTIKFAQNPSQALSQMAQNNPQLKSAIDMCQGRNPKEVFVEQCQQMGYNPDEVIKMLM